MERFPGEKKNKRKTLSPVEIMRARKGDNVPLLSAAGRKGAEKSQQVQREKKAYKEEYEAYLAEQEAEAVQKIKDSTNEHIVPIDPEDQKEAE